MRELPEQGRRSLKDRLYLQQMAAEGNACGFGTVRRPYLGEKLHNMRLYAFKAYSALSGYLRVGKPASD